LRNLSATEKSDLEVFLCFELDFEKWQKREFATTFDGGKFFEFFFTEFYGKVSTFLPALRNWFENFWTLSDDL